MKSQLLNFIHSVLFRIKRLNSINLKKVTLFQDSAKLKPSKIALMKRIEIAVNQLKLGMFVSALDRPWLETPYLIEGVLIKSVEDITELARHCNYVYVDIEKSNPQSISNYAGQGTKSSSQADAATPFHGKAVYVDRCTAEKELPAAQKAYDTTITLIDEIL